MCTVAPSAHDRMVGVFGENNIATGPAVQSFLVPACLFATVCFGLSLAVLDVVVLLAHFTFIFSPSRIVNVRVCAVGIVTIGE